LLLIFLKKLASWSLCLDGKKRRFIAIPPDKIADFCQLNAKSFYFMITTAMYHLSPVIILILNRTKNLMVTDCFHEIGLVSQNIAHSVMKLTIGLSFSDLNATQTG
jgi:hypothetical protein